MSRYTLHRFHCLLAAACLAVCGHLSAQPAPVDDDIRGPKPLVEIPVPEKPPFALWSGIAGGVILLLLAAWLWKKHVRKQRRKGPQEIALSSLAELEATRDSLTAETFANNAAQTVRQYISGRFGLVAPRRTTEEFLSEIARAEDSLLGGQSDHLRTFLKSCDLAKFAGSNLTSHQRGELVEAARGFIHSTSKPASS